MTTIELTRNLHISCVALSFAGFFIRGIWMLRGSDLLRKRWVRITPQVVDTVLLMSAIVLAVQYRFSPLTQPWLMTKIIALVIYIFVGLVALRLGKTRKIRTIAWFSGMGIFIYIVSVAMVKSPLGWLALI